MWTYFTHVAFSCFSVFSSVYRFYIFFFATILATVLVIFFRFTNNQTDPPFWFYSVVAIPIHFVILAGLSQHSTIADLSPKSSVPFTCSLKTALVILAFLLDLIQGIVAPLVFCVFLTNYMSLLSYMKDWQFACFIILLSLYWIATSLQYFLLLLNLSLILCFILSCFLECLTFSLLFLFYLLVCFLFRTLRKVVVCIFQ